MSGQIRARSFLCCLTRKYLRSQMGKKALTHQIQVLKDDVMSSVVRWLCRPVPGHNQLLHQLSHLLLGNLSKYLIYEVKLCHIFPKHIIVWKPFHTYHIMFTLVSLTNWQQEIPGGDELPGQPYAQHGLPKQHQQRHRHVHRNHILLPQVSPNLINSSVLSKYHPDMSQMFE